MSATVDALSSRPVSPGERIPVARYRLRFRMLQALRWPEYAGSLLRGQFGAALRRTACMTGEKACPPCPLYRTCPYPEIFETPPPVSHPLQQFSQMPNPYIIEPPAFGGRSLEPGDDLEFRIVLVGRAISQLPLILHAWQRAFRHGMGKERAQGELVDVALEAPEGYRPVWSVADGRLSDHEASLVVPPLPGASVVRLEFHTPLRLQRQGHALPASKLGPRTLVAALLRRVSLLFEVHAARGGLEPVARALVGRASTLGERKDMTWRDWTRYSSRQQQAMTLGGLVGTWTLTGELAEFLPYLWIGQWVHVGKNATMGLGRYTLQAGEYCT